MTRRAIKDHPSQTTKVLLTIVANSMTSGNSARHFSRSKRGHARNARSCSSSDGRSFFCAAADPEHPRPSGLWPRR
eukprot:330743-Alexandrium_andersonii.AAC.1